jgi:hypothetical protein
VTETGAKETHDINDGLAAGLRTTNYKKRKCSFWKMSDLIPFRKQKEETTETEPTELEHPSRSDVKTEQPAHAPPLYRYLLPGT